MNQELLKLMKDLGMNEEEIKNFEIKMLLSNELEDEKKSNEVEIVSYEEYFCES